MDTIASKKLTREGAMKVLGAAVDGAHALDCHVSIAVVDDGGHLIAFTRSEKAELYSIAIAQAKAKSAALTRFPSGKKSPTGNERDDHHALWRSRWPRAPARLSRSQAAFRSFPKGKSSARWASAARESRTSRSRRPRRRRWANNSRHDDKGAICDILKINAGARLAQSTACPRVDDEVPWMFLLIVPPRIVRR